MSEEPPPGVLGGLPRTRPHRRSDKRAPAAAAPEPKAEPGAVKATKPPSAAKPLASRPATNQRPPKQPSTKKLPVERPHLAVAPPDPADATPGVLGTAVQAAAELAEIGLMAGARALREALSRLPRR